MSSSTFPQNGGQFIGLATKMLNGMNTVGPSVPVILIQASVLDGQITAFTQQDGAYNALRTARQTASDAYTASTAAIYTWLLSARKVLAIHFGDRWSTAWAQAGFINNTTAIPAKIDERTALNLTLIGFFTTQPDYEAPALGVTAAKAAALRTAVLEAQATLSAATQAFKGAGDTWQSAYDALAQTMRELVKNLEAKLADDDTRWLAFGLQMPATPATPGQPVNVAAHMDGNGNILVTCDPVPLATRYRCRTRVSGVQEGYTLAASSLEPVMTFSGIVPGQTLQIIVQAVNGSLQGVPSDSIDFTVLLPAAANAAPESRALLVIEPESNGRHANGNGHHRNGNGNGSALHARAQ